MYETLNQAKAVANVLDKPHKHYDVVKFKGGRWFWVQPAQRQLLLSEEIYYTTDPELARNDKAQK